MASILWVPVVFTTCSAILYWLSMSLPALPEKGLSINSTALKFPSNLEELQALASLLEHYRTNHVTYVLTLYSAAYLFKQAFAIPGSIFLNLLGGALFGQWVGFILTCLLSATGATLCFLLAKVCGRSYIVKYFPDQLSLIHTKLEQNRDSLFFFLMFLRLFPMTPNWFLNMASPVCGVPAHLFFLSVFFGLMPYNFICVQTGCLLSQLTSMDNVFTPWTMVKLFTMATAALIPGLCIKRYQEYRSKQRLERQAAERQAKEDSSVESSRAQDIEYLADPGLASRKKPQRARKLVYDTNIEEVGRAVRDVDVEGNLVGLRKDEDQIEDFEGEDVLLSTKSDRSKDVPSMEGGRQLVEESYVSKDIVDMGSKDVETDPPQMSHVEAEKLSFTGAGTKGGELLDKTKEDRENITGVDPFRVEGGVKAVDVRKEGEMEAASEAVGDEDVKKEQSDILVDAKPHVDSEKGDTTVVVKAKTVEEEQKDISLDVTAGDVCEAEHTVTQDRDTDIDPKEGDISLHVEAADISEEDMVTDVNKSKKELRDILQDAAAGDVSKQDTVTGAKDGDTSPDIMADEVSKVEPTATEVKDAEEEQKDISLAGAEGGDKEVEKAHSDISLGVAAGDVRKEYTVKDVKNEDVKSDQTDVSIDAVPGAVSKVQDKQSDNKDVTANDDVSKVDDVTTVLKDIGDAVKELEDLPPEVQNKDDTSKKEDVVTHMRAVDDVKAEGRDLRVDVNTDDVRKDQEKTDTVQRVDDDDVSKKASLAASVDDVNQEKGAADRSDVSEGTDLKGTRDIPPGEEETTGAKTPADVQKEETQDKVMAVEDNQASRQGGEVPDDGGVEKAAEDIQASRQGGVVTEEVEKIIKVSEKEEDDGSGSDSRVSDTEANWVLVEDTDLMDSGKTEDQPEVHVTDPEALLEETLRVASAEKDPEPVRGVDESARSSDEKPCASLEQSERAQSGTPAGQGDAEVTSTGKEDQSSGEAPGHSEAATEQVTHPREDKESPEGEKTDSGTTMR